MKIVVRTVLFHILCIIVFSFIYYLLSEDFENHLGNKKYNSLIDFISLSTTIQAGVGFSNLLPIDCYGKLAVTIQQIILILSHIITLYVFTL
jgi:hypothetical protein